MGNQGGKEGKLPGETFLEFWGLKSFFLFLKWEKKLSWAVGLINFKEEKPFFFNFLTFKPKLIMKLVLGKKFRPNLFMGGNL